MNDSLTQPADGTTLYYALLYNTEQERRQFMHMLQLITALECSMHEVTEPQVAEKKVHWWHEELARLGKAQARHPVCLDVQGFIYNEQVVTHSLAVLSAAANERYSPAQSIEDWQLGLQQDYNARLALLQLALASGTDLPVHTHNSKEARQSPAQANAIPNALWMAQLALALGHFDCLDNLALLLHKGLAVYSDAHYQQHKLQPEKLIEARAKTTESDVHNFIQKQLQLALAEFDKLAEMLKRSDSRYTQHELPFLILAKLRHKQLQLWQKQQPDLLRESIKLTPITKFWHAWRCRRHYLSMRAVA